ncbi:MAG: phosphate acyltransferase PlsX [Ktedonobacterales bacterium]|nr:phosphate acyltransferase PlsX [Ktedonobacterales bacterium]
MAQPSENPARRVALDVMGGDHAPQEVVAGAVQAAREGNIGIILVGPEPAIREEMAKYDTGGLDLTIEHTDEVIGMDEHPAEAVRARPRNTLSVCMQLIKDGRADAMASAGNSGAVVTAAVLGLGRIKGVPRPALGAVLPTATGKPTLLLDIGATTDSKPDYLAQYALMGSAYMQGIFDIAQPRVALLANGEEDGKGDQLVQAAHGLIRAIAAKGMVNFVGNVEGRDIPKGEVDVIVCDGFVGNVALKLSEGLSRMLLGAIRTEIYSNPINQLGGLILKGAFNKVRAKLDDEEYGGAPLLGVRGVAIVGHGSSHARAIKNMIRVARQAGDQQLPAKIAEGVAAAGAATTEA